VVLAPDGEGSVALHLRSGTYFHLDRTATEIVRLVQEGGPEGAAGALARRYGLSPQRAQEDVAGALRAIEGQSSSGGGRSRRPTRRGTLAVAKGWLHLGRREKAGAIGAAALVGVVELLLHTVRVDRAARLLRTPLLDGPGGEELAAFDFSALTLSERDHLLALAWVQRIWLWDATCLRRALATGWALRRRHPRLCIGLTGTEDVLAHAWLVVEGRAVDGLPGAQVFRRATTGPSPTGLGPA
jgi:hypothetical protein